MGVSGFIVTHGNLVMAAVMVVVSQGYTPSDRVIDMTPLTIRVVTGTVALLPCRVDPRYTEKHADQYKVVWVNPSKTAISLQDRRIINDQRISVERPFLKDWNLHIRNVSLTDAGIYKCQINTSPVGTKNITLIVQDPPRIIDHSMPLEVQSEEKGKVELFCNATGSPDPNITWFRLNKNTHGGQEKVGNVGNSLVIRNISRMCADSYMCVASNGVEPSDTQTFQVSVLYPPEVILPNTRLGQQVGRDTILECEVTASPLAYVVWKYRNRTLMNSANHELTLYNTDPESEVVLSLRIRKVKPKDYGMYECEANNKLGYKREYMELYELRKKTTTTTTTTTTELYDNWNSRDQDANVYRGNERGRGGGGGHANENGKNQGLIWARQENGQKPPYSSGKDSLRTKVGEKENKNSREQTGYSGMRSRNNNGDEGSATGLMASGLVLLISAVACHTVVYAVGR